LEIQFLDIGYYFISRRCLVLPTFNLDRVIAALSFPCSGRDFIAELERQDFPEGFLNELKPMLRARKFVSADALHGWLSANLTTHMAGLLGGASVQDLIRKAKSI
jgi:hypothetical protein